MANYIVQDTSLAAVADAIRAKTGGAEPLVFPAGFVEAVEGIKGGAAAPFCVASLSEGAPGATMFESAVNIAICVSVSAEDYVV